MKTVIDNEWYIGREIAYAIGWAGYHSAITRYVKDEDKRVIGKILYINKNGVEALQNAMRAKSVVCKDCGKTFVPKHNNSIFCSKKCNKHWSKNNDIVHAQGDEVLRTFICKQCHKTVAVTTKKDLRTQFCSNYCSRCWHRHEYKRRNGTHGNSTLSSAMSLGGLIRRESFTLNQD